MANITREEELQVDVHIPPKRAGVSSIPPIEPDAPKHGVGGQLPGQLHDRWQGGQGHLCRIVERSITAERLVDELEKVFIAAGGPPRTQQMDSRSGLVLPSATTVLRPRGRQPCIPPGTPCNSGCIESFNNQLRNEGAGWSPSQVALARFRQTASSFR